MLTAALLFVHLVAFAAYLGAGFGQLRLMKLSARPGTAPALRDAYERIAFVTQNPALMKQGWLHGKLLCVLLLAILSHLEMFNARKIVRAREAGGAGADDEIGRRKARHSVLGGVGSLLVVALLVLVTFVRLK